MKKPNRKRVKTKIFVIVFAVGIPLTLIAQEQISKVEAMKSQYLGQRKDQPVMRSRGLTRGGTNSPEKIRSNTRSVVIPTRSVGLIARGGAIFLSAENESDATSSKTKSVAELPPLVEVKKVLAPTSNSNSQHGEIAVAAGKPATEISYSVDPDTGSEVEIFFKQGSSEIDSKKSAPFLKAFASVVKLPEFEKFSFAVEGHASAEGTPETNQDLSQNRANAVFYELVNKYKVEPKQLLPIGFGESRATVPAGAPDAARARDRKVLVFKMDK